MPSIWRSKTISTWPSRATTFRLRTPIFSVPRLAAFFAESMPAWCRVLPEAELEDLARARPALEPAARPVERAEQERALRDSCSPPWAQAHRSILTIRQSRERL